MTHGDTAYRHARIRCGSLRKADSVCGCYLHELRHSPRDVPRRYAAWLSNVTADIGVNSCAEGF